MSIEIRCSILSMFIVASCASTAAAESLRPQPQPIAKPAATRPNFTGVWEMDMKASRLADGQPIEARGQRAMTLTLVHTEPQIAVHYDVKGVDATGDRQQAYIVPTDGTKKDVVLNGLPAVAWAKWEGDSLVVYHKRALPNNGYTETRRVFTLDGHSMRSVPKFRNAVDGKETPEFGGETEVWHKR